MFMLMQLAQTNELTYDAHLCYCWIQSYINVYQVFLLLFKISINFNAEENIWPLERLEYYLQQEIQGMLKSFTITHGKKYSHEYFVESNSPILRGVVLVCLGYSWFTLHCPCLFQLFTVGMGCSTICKKKWRYIRLVKNLKHLKKWRHVRHLKNEGTLKKEGA